jgi:hypothetical protein
MWFPLPAFKQYQYIFIVNLLAGNYCLYSDWAVIPIRINDCRVVIVLECRENK